MKKEQLTDRIIRNKLKYHASASPDHLWEAIEAELPVDAKKDRGIFWWMSGGFLCLALLSAGLFYFGAGEESANSTSNVDASTISTSNTDIASNTNLLTNEEQASISNTVEKEEINTTGIAKESTNTNLVSAKNTSITSRKTNFRAINNKASNSATTTENKKSANFSDSQATNKNIEASNQQTAETKVSAEAKFDIASLKETSSYASLDLSSQEMLSLDAKEKELDWPSLLQDPKCATFGKWLKLHFYGDAYVSPDVAFRELESKEAAYERYADDRRATESQRLSFSTGLRFSVVSNFGISARTGIVYSQINEKFDYQEERTEVVISDVFDSAGNLISSDTAREAGTHYITTYNRYRMIDVPLLLGYEVAFKKFSLSVNSGVYANLISRQKGDFLSPELRPVTFTTDARDTYPAFRKRLNFSLYGSVAMYINLNKHWQFMMEPQVRYFLDPMTQSSYIVKQKYITTGLITGLRYRF